MEPNEKELLTMERCRMDLRFRLKHALIERLALACTLALVLAALSILFADRRYPEALSAVLHWGALALLSVPVFYFAWAVVTGVRKWLWIKRTSFSLAEDTLCKTNTIPTKRELYRRYAENIVYYTYHWEFLFSEHGVYTAKKDHATWNKTSRMSSRALYRSADAGDKFYLILDGQGKILLAYPCKYFRWQENT